MTPEELSRASDDELYALEQERTLEPGSWAQIASELQRRKQSRRAALADVPRPTAEAPTLGDLERIANTLEVMLDARLVRLDARMRRLRWWVLAGPVIWVLVGAGTWLALREWAPALLERVGGLP